MMEQLTFFNRIKEGARGALFILRRAVKKFLYIDGAQWAGAVALLALVWTSLQCFTTLICADNLAWGVPEKEWWRRN